MNQAIENTRKLLRGSQKKNPNVWVDYAKQLSELQYGDELVKALRQLERLVPRAEHAKIYPMAAHLLTKAWKYDDALAYWQKLGESKEWKDRAWQESAKLYERVNEISKARACLARVAPEAVSPAVEARLLRREGRMDEVVDYVGKVLQGELKNDVERSELQHELYKAYDAEGEFSKAWDALLEGRRLRVEAFGRQKRQDILQRRRETFAVVQQALQSLGREQVERWMETDLRWGANELVLMMGMPRSGTTLLERMLAESRQVVTTDERDAVVRNVFEPAGARLRPLEGEEFWRQIDGFDDKELRARLTAYRDDLRGQMDCPLAKKIVIEKNPALMESCFLVPRVMPGVRVLVPVRDPRAVLWSMWQVSVGPPTEISLFWDELDSLADWYGLAMSVWGRMRELLPEKYWLEVRYEDVVAGKQSVWDATAKFVGLEPGEGFPVVGRDGSIVRTPNYESVAEPVYTRALEHWKNYAQWMEPVYTKVSSWTEKLGYV